MLSALRLRLPRLSPAVRIGLGLSSLVVALLLIIDILFGVFPNPSATLAEQRTRLAEQIALQTVVLLEVGQEEALGKSVAIGMSRDPSLSRIRIERRDGTILLDRRAPGMPSSAATDPDNAYRVPLMTAGGEWGRVSVWYREPASRRDSLLQTSPLLLVIIGVGLVCFVAFALYLRRVLSHLDPASVVPERIRQAFDVFSTGIVVVDRKASILLANERFTALMGLPPDAVLTGRALHSLPALAAALPTLTANHPWALAMDARETLSGARVDIAMPDGTRRRLLVNSAPIDDGDDHVRGCLVSLEDITAIVDLNEQLERSNADLLRSKQDIEQMNIELTRLATRDPLTGAYNRRALFDRFETLLVQARAEGSPLCCIMTDIDHFKRFNDQHGHAVGDAVLRAVSQLFANELRDHDVLARYGGEEFCIILPGVDLVTATQIAERLRAAIEAGAGQSIREPRGLTITASFGVCALTPDVRDPDHLIDLADQALYAAKEAGRNRVVTTSVLPSQV